LFVDDIHKIFPSGLGPKYSRLLYGFFLTISLPPMFDMRDNLKCTIEEISTQKCPPKEKSRN
jgi:hypothetical protein